MTFTSDAVSVCIPAYDESTTIAGVLRQVARSASKVVGEILVCANGCTDDTEAIVEKLALEDPRIRLLRSPPGKPHAWNALVHQARAEILVFCDADNRLGPGALEHLRDALVRTPRALLASGVEQPFAAGPGLEQRIAALASHPFGHDFVTGRLYAFRKEALLERFVREGFSGTSGPAMPTDLVHEDLWLELLLEPEERVTAPLARVHFTPGLLEDFLRQRLRIRLAREQLAERYPSLHDRWRRGGETLAPARLRTRFRTLLEARTLPRACVGLATRLAVHGVLRRRARALLEEMRAEALERGGESVMRGSGRLTSPRGPG